MKPTASNPKETLVQYWTEGMEQSDWALVERCQNDDLQAFEQLVEKYKNKVYNYVYRMLNDPEEAEDITQEVFVRAFAAIKQFRGQASFQTWLYRITVNLCVDCHRRRERGPQVVRSLDAPVEGEKGEVELEVPDWKYNPEAHLLTKELNQQIHLALKQLSEKLRTVILLHDLQGLSYEEIAQIVGCPLGTVKSRLFNARLALREKLRPYLEGLPEAEPESAAVSQ